MTKPYDEDIMDFVRMLYSGPQAMNLSNLRISEITAERFPGQKTPTEKAVQTWRFKAGKSRGCNNPTRISVISEDAKEWAKCRRINEGLRTMGWL